MTKQGANLLSELSRIVGLKQPEGEQGELTRSQKGKQYEDVALGFLLRQKLQLIERNYLCQCGELDLLMQEGRTLVIVEVRYRKSNRYGDALESVGKTKQARIIAATKHYIVTHKIDQPMRFDVVGITGDNPPIWVKNAF